MTSVRIFLVVATLLIGVYCQNSRSRQNNNYNQEQETNTYSPQIQSSSRCPQPNGTFPTNTCDGYIECVNGVPEEKLCADGLLFNAASSPHAFPCQYPVDVDCTGREQTQTPQPTADCPHQFGYFKVGDRTNCGKFMNCVDGRGFVFDCPEGLAWNSETYRCDWADQAPDCDAEAFLGFSCPPEAREFGFGEAEYRFFRSPNDCQTYYLCINNRPRIYHCGEGLAYNDITNECDGFENVTGCALPDTEFKGAPTTLPKFSNEGAYNKFNKV